MCLRTDVFPYLRVLVPIRPSVRVKVRLGLGTDLYGDTYRHVRGASPICVRGPMCPRPTVSTPYAVSKAHSVCSYTVT